MSHPSPCFALWVTVHVSREKAKESGLQVRSQAAGSNRVSVELELKTEGEFQEFGPNGKYKHHSRVELWIGQNDNPQVTAALREDRSKAGRVVVSFTVDRTQLDQSRLRVMVPNGDGGTEYQLRVKDFVD